MISHADDYVEILRLLGYFESVFIPINSFLIKLNMSTRRVKLSYKITSHFKKSNSRILIKFKRNSKSSRLNILG